MVKEFLSNIFYRRNPWRNASFSEVGQLYAARSMRTIAVHLGAAFMSVFMLKQGYSIIAVSLFWAAYFGYKVIAMLPLAQLIAYIGPKKAIIISNLLYIPSMVAFIFLEQFGTPVLVVTILFQGASAALYDMGYFISFSRVNNAKKAGKEVAMVNMADQIAKALSPLIGGLLAMFFDPRASIAVSIVFFILAAWPLTRTADTMATGFSLSPKGFPWKDASRSLIAQIPIGFDIYASGTAWSLFLASLIFTAQGNQIYAELGMLTSLILLVSLASTYAYGKLIDKRAGGQLLTWAAAGNAIVHLFRALIRTPVAAVGANAVSEVMVTGYSMAFMRGTLDVANNIKYRVFYAGMLQLAINFGLVIASLVLAGVMFLLDTRSGFTIFYLITALVSSAIIFTKFKIYK